MDFIVDIFRYGMELVMRDFDYIDNYVSLTYDDGSHPMSPYYNQPEEEDEELEEIDEDLLIDDEEEFDLIIKEKEEKKIDELDKS